MAAVTLGVGTAAALAGKTAAGAKLAGLTGLLSGLNPFTIGGALKPVQHYLLGGSALYGLPGMIERGILDEGKNLDGEYDVNPIVQLLGGDRFSQEALTAKGQKRDLRQLKKDPMVRTRYGADW